MTDDTASLSITSKWIWMADWCKVKLINPHDSYFWKLAETSYNNYMKGKHE